MKRIIPSNERKDEFLKCYYSNFYQLQKPLIAVAVKDIDASNLLNISIKSGNSLIIKSISLNGWCFIQIDDQSGFCPCMLLQIQQDAQEIPSEYIKQFFSPVIKKVASKASTDSLHKEQSYTFVIHSFLKPTVNIEMQNPKLYPKYKEKTVPLKKVQYGPCQECDVSFTPEWRTGPKGKRSLCNACGLRFSKRQKALKDIEANSDDQSYSDEKVATLKNNYYLSSTKYRCPSRKAKSKPIEDDYNDLKIKNPQVKKQKTVVTEEDGRKDSIPVNKSSLAFILS